MLRRLGVAVILVATLAACGDSDDRELRPPGPDQTRSISTVGTTTTSATGGALTSGSNGTTTGTAAPATPFLVTPWSETGEIDPRYSCNGQGVSPALSWNDLPAGTVELAIVVTDPDASGFVHWVLAGLNPAAATFLQEATVPAGAVQALNGFGQAAWGGPCPPAGERHTYEATLYALARPSGVTQGQDAAAAIAAIQAAAIGSATVSGDYGG